MHTYRNILIIQTAFIGDAILASSLVEKFHSVFPQSSISILVRKGNESIFHNHPFLKQVLIWDKTQNKFQNLLSLLFKIRKNKYDCVINCHRHASSGLLTTFSGARHTSGFKENPFSALFNFNVKHKIGDGRHEIERYNELVEDFAGKQVFKPKLYPTDADFAHVKPLQLKPYVCMAPASVWFTKQLPFEKWIELCDKQDFFKTIYLLGASGDVTLCEKIKNQSTHPDIVVVAGKLTLLQSAALLKNAVMNFVNDSAPLHLTSATNAPVTAFFCSTVTQFGFGPLSDNAVVKGVDHLDCRPCGIHGYKNCPLGHFNCGHLMDLSS